MFKELWSKIVEKAKGLFSKEKADVLMAEDRMKGNVQSFWHKMPWQVKGITITIAVAFVIKFVLWLEQIGVISYVK